MKDVLLTVSGTIPEDIEGKISRGERPTADYVAMARAFQADLLDYPKARSLTGRRGRWLEKIGGPNLMLAWACFMLRSQYRVIFTDGEQVGIPFALLLKFLGGNRRPRHLMIGHILSVPKKMAIFDLLGIQSHIDIFFLYSTWQKGFIQKRWRIPEERAIFTPFMVDALFFDPTQVKDFPRGKYKAAGDIPLICSVGLEYRDYPTLIEAVRGQKVKAIIAAASPWSKRGDTTEGAEIPENVTVQRFSQYELRNVYAECDLVVMPLYNVNFQAGVTAILEAMAMEKPVICTRTPGQTDVVVEGKTGRYVPPGDPHALRTAILDLLDQTETAREMGYAGRERVLDEMSLEQYTRRLLDYVKKA